MRVKDIANFNPKGVKPADFINYIDTSSVEEGRLIDVQSLSKDIPSRAQRVVALNDILISSVRPNLKHNYFVDRVIEHCIASTGFIQIRVTSNNVLPRFLYYYLTEDSKVCQYQTIAETSQSTFPSFNKDVIENLDFPDISLQDQQHIVDILGSIDEKIENNRLLQQGLIAYGLKIFENRSRQSKTDHSFGELFSFINGFSFKSTDYKETGKYKVITIKNITENGFNSDNADKIDYSDSFAKSRLSIGDVLLTMTGEVGRVGIVDIDNALLNQRVLKVVGQSSFFTYFALLSNSNNIKTLAKGSVQQNLGLKELSKYLIACDNVESYKQYDWITTKLLSISKENKSLNALKQLYLKKFFG